MADTVRSECILLLLLAGVVGVVLLETGCKLSLTFSTSLISVFLLDDVTDGDMPAVPAKCPFLASVMTVADCVLLILLVTGFSFGLKSLGERLKLLATMGDRWVGLTGIAGRSQVLNPGPDFNLSMGVSLDLVRLLAERFETDSLSLPAGLEDDN